MRRPTRFLTRALCLATLVAALFFPISALASAALPTPTFVLAWGKLGPSPGQFSAPLATAVDRLGNVFVVDTGNSRIEEFDRLGNFIRQWGSFGSGPQQFNQPAGIAFDPYGDFYVSDAGNNRIQKYSATGFWLLQWGAAGTGNGQFNVPVGIACDASGNVYVVDQANRRVQKFNGNGGYLAQWGSLGSGAGQFNAPFGITVDPAANVFVADQFNNRIQKFTNEGVYMTQWGSAGTGNGQFSNPTGVAVDPLGNVYVTDYDNNRLQKFDGSGTFIGKWGSAGSGDGEFNSPVGVAVDAAANLYIADRLNQRIQKFSGVGAVLTEMPDTYLLEIGGPGSTPGSFLYPFGVATQAGYVWVTDQATNRVEVFTLSGTYITQWGTVGTGDGQFNAPIAIAADPFGYNFVCDYNNERIQEFDGFGEFMTKWGTPGSGNGQFNGPSGIAADMFHNVYVADQANHRIQKFLSDGTYLGQWGTQGTGDGQFQYPVGVAVDLQGNVYVTDEYNNRVEKFTSNGTYILKWGSTGTGNGQFNFPYGIAVDAQGNVCVADQNNNRVQKFTSNGTYLAQWGYLNQPLGLCTDVAGNLYVVDSFNHRIAKYATAPAIGLVSDVVNDQGRQAQIRFLRSSADSYQSGVPVTGYEIYRRNDPIPGATGVGRAPDAASAGRAHDAANVTPMLAGVPASADRAELAGWTYLATAPAHGESEYSVIVPTLADATSSTLEYTSFMVRAATSIPTTIFDSAADYGFSIDNLAPGAPAPFTAAYLAGATHLHWGISTAPDFATFHLYRGTNAGFVPTPATFVTAINDTTYTDPGAAGSYYKLAAVDWNGNESPYAVVGPNQTLDAPPLAAPEFALQGIRPNPSLGERLVVDFALPSSEPATLELIDIAGRRVATRSVGALGAGRHTIDLAAAHRPAAGVYLVRLVQGARSDVTRVVVL